MAVFNNLPVKPNKLIKKSIASFADQSTFSGANFAINILFARWMSVDNYGHFTMAYSVFLFWFFAVSALQLEPIAIFRHKEENGAGDFLTASLIATALLLVFLQLLFIPIYFLFFKAVDGFSPFPLFLACLGTGLFWTLRQFSYADNRPWMAFIQTASYAIGLLAAAIFTGKSEVRSTDDGLLVLAEGAGIAVLAGLAIVRHSLVRFTLKRAYAIMVENVKYGIWSLPSNIAAWLAANIFLITLPAYGNPEAGARLKTLLNILLPFQQFLAGISLLFMPILAKLHVSKNGLKFEKASKFLLIVGTSGGILMSIIMYFSGGKIYSFIYGGEYAKNSDIIIMGLALPVIMATISIFRIITRAANEPDKQFRAYLIGTLVVGSIAVPVGTAYGLTGSIVGMTVMQAVTLMVMVFDYRNRQPL